MHVELVAFAPLSRVGSCEDCRLMLSGKQCPEDERKWRVLNAYHLEAEQAARCPTHHRIFEPAT